MQSDSTAEKAIPPMPRSWRWALGGGVLFLVVFTFFNQSWMGPRGQSAVGLVCFFGLVAAFSSNLRAVNWRTIGFGMLIQILLALFILQTTAGKEIFLFLANIVEQFLNFTNAGSEFVFGPVAKREVLAKAFGPKNGFVFAFSALPTIIFVSAFFSVLYFFGVLQFLVRVMAKVMMYLMGTSGAETLSSAANVFMGQTEAPFIVRPYIVKMTQSELLALMAGGMATVSGGVMAIYITFGADSVALLATSVMAAPCALYLSKLLLPETEEPQTRGEVRMHVEQTHRNAIDAAADGALGGLKLALNVAAVLIAFIAFVALIDYVLWQIDSTFGLHLGLSLKNIFSLIFRPFAMLIGVEGADIPHVANLLGTKLAVNELVAFGNMQEMKAAKTFVFERSDLLATYALTGFANFASVGIQIGGIGAIAPERRSDLARLGIRALFIGFLATMINAALVGTLL